MCITDLLLSLQVARNNAKTETSDLQYRLEQSEKERTEALQEVESLREHIDQLQQDCDAYLDEKKTFTAKVRDTNVLSLVLFRLSISFISSLAHPTIFNMHQVLNT